MEINLDSFVEKLLKEEDDSVTSVMAFISYNPSIGRVLEKGGVKLFQKIIHQLVNELSNIQLIEEFDVLHKKYIEMILNKLKTSRGTDISYGQAQKPINVFFKVYVDWARKPNEEIRSKILSFLHVPLDSVLMKTIKEEYPDWYNIEIKPLQKSQTQEFSLSMIDEEIYIKWQRFFRERYPTKPLIFDVAWAINR